MRKKLTKEPLGIFIITTNFGGAETLLTNLLQLTKRRVVVITNDEIISFFKEKSGNKKVKFVSVGRYSLPKISFFRRIKKIFYWFYYAYLFNRVCEKYDLKYIDIHLEVALMAAALCRRFLNPDIHLNLSCHGYEVRRFSGGRSIKYYKYSDIQFKYFTWALKYFSSFIFFHKEVEDESKKINILKNKPCKLIHPGVDIRKYKPQKKRKFSFVFSARLVPSKQPDLAIKIAPYLIAEFPDIRMQILGKGPMEKELKDMVKKSRLSKYIRFCGEVEDTSEFLNRSEIFLGLQTIGNFGSISLFEAMASGMTCIATKTPEWKSVPKNLVHFVHISDHRKIAQEIIKLLKNNKQKSILSKNARDFVVKNRSAGRMAKEYFGFVGRSK